MSMYNFERVKESNGQVCLESLNNYVNAYLPISLNLMSMLKGSLLFQRSCKLVVPVAMVAAMIDAFLVSLIRIKIHIMKEQILKNSPRAKINNLLTSMWE